MDLFLSWLLDVHNYTIFPAAAIVLSSSRLRHILAESAICNGDFWRIMQQSRFCRTVLAYRTCRLHHFTLTRRKNAVGTQPAANP